MKIITRPVVGGAKQDVWERRYKAFHYDPETLLKSCECHIVYVEGYNWVGFIAANMHQERWGKGSGVWYAHKTAVCLPKDHPDYFRVWALVADHQAQMQVARGRRFVCKAPADHVAYRDQPNSGWVPASKDKKCQKDGYRSHRYVGTAMAAKAGVESVEAAAEPARPSKADIAAAMETLLKSGFLQVGINKHEDDEEEEAVLLLDAIAHKRNIFFVDQNGGAELVVPMDKTFFVRAKEIALAAEQEPLWMNRPVAAPKKRKSKKAANAR